MCAVNPFTHIVELIRFALYGQIEPLSLGVVAATTGVLLAAAIWSYDPARGFRAARMAGAGD